MTEIVVDGLTVSLEGPPVLRAAVALGAAAPGPAEAEPELRLVFRNDGAATLRFPAVKIGRSVTRLYDIPGSSLDAPLEDGMHPPTPRLEPTALGPGAVHAALVPVKAPAALASLLDPRVALRVGVRWRAAELDPAEFPPEAVGWNADFELWTSIAIAPEDEPPAR